MPVADILLPAFPYRCDPLCALLPCALLEQEAPQGSHGLLPSLLLRPI